MNGEVLITNIFNLFIVAIILEASVMALFTMAFLQRISHKAAVESVRDIMVLLIAVALCYQVEMLKVFTKTGIKVPPMLDVVISALVLTRMTKLIMAFFSKIKYED